MVEVIIASKNEGKIREITEILSELKTVKFLSLKDYPDIPKIVEDGSSFEENAAKKAITVATYTGKIALADDSGLEVEALDGAPGIKSSRFDKDDKARNQKLLRLLKDVPQEKRMALFRCVIAIADSKGGLSLSRGSCQGMITFETRGEHGFGYDPIFIIPKYSKTLAELGPKIKNRVSHRAKALKRAKKILREMVSNYLKDSLPNDLDQSEKACTS